jgi:hypothetical protein
MDMETAKAINAVSNKVNDMAKRLDDFFNMRADKNAEGVADSQNATCELSEEVDERITDIEIALCELSEDTEE